MVYLHNDKNAFTDALNHTRVMTGIITTVIEKDYYVTMILKGLSERLPYIVFKGGTSLSKCHRIIKRFSEDIDVTVDVKLSQGQMGKVKDAIKAVANDLGLLIPNIGETRSRRSYNKYILAYQSVMDFSTDVVPPSVILETSFAEVSFPTVILPVHSYVGEILRDEAPGMVAEFNLEPFEMKVQGIDRTMIDKVFAICDYYMKGDVRRHSRHIYDIYKLLMTVPLDDKFKNLVKEVRGIRAVNVRLCPSAQPDVDVQNLLEQIIKEDVYRADYNNLTSRILGEQISYGTAISAIKKIAESGIF